MRLYIKLFLMIVAFYFASRLPFRDATSGIAYDIQFLVISHFGTASEYQAFMDATDLKMAEEANRVEMYLMGKECRRRIEKRIAVATARAKRPLTQDELDTITFECQHAILVPSRGLDGVDLD
ncbi:MAG TPA: hypothetical protein VL282_01790 [Tepidisphaeraceae bacterium]|jgi:hypothetical protein|nr:hypothetical protein [Tepidisphaeraceae bacterium]